MSAINTDALKYGVIGLSFLLAYLSYLLLKSEQNRDVSRPAFITAIYVFIGFSLVLCCIGLFSEFHKGKTQNSCEKERDSYKAQLESTSHIIEALLEAKIGQINSLPEGDPVVKGIKNTLNSLDQSIKKELGKVD